MKELEQTEELISLIRNRTLNLFSTGQMMCSEAVLTVLNQSFDGGLSPEIAMKLASGLPEGMGSSGCTCGALTGGVVALGLFLGRGAPAFGRPKAMDASRQLHDRFKSVFGSTCCRVLIRKYRSGSNQHIAACAEHSGWTAEQAARLILKEKPDILFGSDQSFLLKNDSVIHATLRKIFNTVSGFGKRRNFP